MMTLSITPKPSPEHHNKKRHDALHEALKSSHTVYSHPQTPLIQLKPVCPCDGGCPRCSEAIQAKLSIGQPNDKYELEADRVAEQVMRMPENTGFREQGLVVRNKDELIQPKPACPSCKEEEEEELLQTKSLVQRWLVDDDAASALEAPSSVHDVLRSPGQPLDSATRAFFEPRFGHDFSQVRVHTDTKAAESARAVNALAYTVGNYVVFGARQYNPESKAGRRLLAHELTHTIQQRSSSLRLDRQCDPAWAGLDWSDRVANVRAMANGAARDQCMTDMIDEALGPNVTVHQSTNAAGSIGKAITAGYYTEWGTLSDLHVNFDRTLNAKTGNPHLFGDTQFYSPPGGGDISIFIILGPTALDPVGPQYTQMALHHEKGHAQDFLSQFTLSDLGPPHAATPGEELAIYAEDFSKYFLDLWEIDNTAGTFRIANNFSALFSNYALATQVERDSAFNSIQMFYNVQIQGILCNEMKFKIWLQMMQNARPAADALVKRINALPGLGLIRETAPNTHFNPALNCA